MSKETTHRIHRHNYESFFTVLPNHLWENEFISWGAKSLLAYMLSRPLDWEIYRSHLSKIYKGDKRGNGKDSVDSFFKELIKHKFIKYTAKDKKTGKFIHRYDVYPEPFEEMDKEEEGGLKPQGVKPVMGLTPNGLNSPQPRNNSIPIKESKKHTGDKPPSIPKNKIERALHVHTTEEEHNVLMEEHGQEKTEKFYKILSEWKDDKPKGRWRKSDHNSILRWVIEAEMNSKQRTKDKSSNCNPSLSAEESGQYDNLF